MPDHKDYHDAVALFIKIEPNVYRRKLCAAVLSEEPEALNIYGNEDAVVKGYTDTCDLVFDIDRKFDGNTEAAKAIVHALVEFYAKSGHEFVHATNIDADEIRGVYLRAQQLLNDDD
jgi:hypothetical protein